MQRGLNLLPIMGVLLIALLLKFANFLRRFRDSFWPVRRVELLSMTLNVDSIHGVLSMFAAPPRLAIMWGRARGYQASNGA